MNSIIKNFKVNNRKYLINNSNGSIRIYLIIFSIRNLKALISCLIILILFTILIRAIIRISILIKLIHFRVFVVFQGISQINNRKRNKDNLN